MVKDPKLLRKNYTKTPFVYLDILSVLPTDITYFFLESKCSETVPCPVIGNIENKISKLIFLFDAKEKFAYITIQLIFYFKQIYFTWNV